MRLLVPALAALMIAGPALAVETMSAPKPLTRAEAQARLAEIFKRNDVNGDGAITLAEQGTKIDDMIAKRPSGAPAPTAAQLAQLRKNAADSFARADTNGDGKITTAEAARQPMAMFDRADTNKDGVLSPEEQIAGVRAMQAARQGGQPPR